MSMRLLPMSPTFSEITSAAPKHGELRLALP
jgi:hypothetical protein